jgi:hypothetical protein
MERIKISGTSVAADTDGLATATECTGAGPWVPNVATSAGDELGHLITITQISATNHSAKTAIITGTDANGNPQTETGLALPNGAATVTSTKHFATVTSVAISATIGADTMTMGWAAEAVSPWKNVQAGANLYSGFNMGIGCTITDSPTYTVQYTFDGSAVFDHATIASKTVNFSGQQAFPVTAVRLKWTAAGGVALTALQY